MVSLIGIIILVSAINDFENSILILFLSIITIVLGFSKVVSGGFALKKLWIPYHAPNEFTDSKLLINAIKTGKIGLYKIDKSFSIELLKLFGSKNVYFMRGYVKNIAQASIIRAFNYSILIVFLIILYTLQIVNISFTFYAFAIFIMLSGTIVNFFFSLRLIPKEMPSAFRIHKTNDIQGGHPKKVYRVLIDGLKALKYDYPKRFIGNEPNVTNEGVENTGTTKGFTLIENQPIPIENKNISSANLALFAGYTLWFFGFLFMLVENKFSSINLGDFALPITGILMVGMGNSLIKDSHVLFNQFYFKSNVILTELNGEYYQSDVGVGKGVSDSLQSERRGVLSDIRLEHYIASILSVLKSKA